MKKLLLLTTSLFLLQTFTACSGSSAKTQEEAVSPAAAPEPIKMYDYYGADNKRSLKEAIAHEYEAGRIPIVYFWATWCGPCKEFKQSLHDPLMEDALKNVTLIMLDLDVDAKKENYSETYGVTGVPAFLKFDKDGKLLKQVDGGAWDENIPKNMAPVLKPFVQE